MITALAIILGAAWRRWLGMHAYGERWQKVGVGCAILPLMLLAAGHEPWQAAVVGLFIVGWFTVEHGNWMDMGTMPVKDVGYLDHVLPKVLPWPNGSREYDAAAFAIHYTIPGVVALVFLGSLAAPLAGVIAAAGYLAALALWVQLPKRDPWLDHWTAYGELVLGGAVIGLAV